MRVEDCYQLGYIVKPHGLQGEVNVFLDVDFPEDYQHLESVFVVLPDTGTLVPFFVEYLSISDNKVICKLEDIDTIEQAAPLAKAPLYLPLENLPILEEGQFYYHEIIGFAVQDEKEGVLGIVENVYEGNGQDLIVMQYKNQEVLIPMTDDIVPKVDKQQKIVFTRLPEGLLDVYLS